MSRTRSFRLSMFAMLYFVQGVGLAYFRNFQKPYLSKLSIDADVIGALTSILLLPFILKIFIGMLSDRFNLFGQGHRKPYMVIGLLLAALAFGGAGFVLPDRNFALFATLIVLGSFSVALFDSTSDGLAIDITPDAEQGTVQGTMVGGRAVGFILLSLVFGWLVQGSSYQVVFWVIGVGMLVPLVWVLRVKEPEQVEKRVFEWGAFRELLRPVFGLFALYAVFYSVASYGVDGLVTFFLSDKMGAAESVIGQYGALRGVGAVLGAVLGGVLIDRLGWRRSAFGALALVSLCAVLLGFSPGIPFVLVMGVVWGAVWGFQETLFLAMAMGMADARIAATLFALMMALSNVGTAVGEGVATGLTDNIGFSAVFLLLAGLNVINLPVLLGFFRARAVRQDPIQSIP